MITAPICVHSVEKRDTTKHVRWWLAKCCGLKESLALCLSSVSLSELPLFVLRLASQKESNCCGSLPPNPITTTTTTTLTQALVLKAWSLMSASIIETWLDPNGSTWVNGSIQRWSQNLLALLAGAGVQVGGNSHWGVFLGDISGLKPLSLFPDCHEVNSFPPSFCLTTGLTTTDLSVVAVSAVKPEVGVHWI